MLGWIGPALACGGFMCDSPTTPVVQNAERIAFHIDEDAGTVEAHVQVFYEGPPDRFAWVVPVAAEPEVFISTDQLFTAANQQFAPVVQLTRLFEGRCGPIRVSVGCGGKDDADTDASFDTDDGGENRVVVVNEGQVGPYDYAVLTATSEDALMTWLSDNSYDIPPQTSDLLAPYIAGDAHFLTVRLMKGRDTGDIAPLGWKYAGTEASIPIQLTALAAAPDMGLEVYVFGEHRAVPTSYLHVQVNPANLDWFDEGSNYYDVVSRAADQAGGHAFATDYAGEVTLSPFWFEAADADVEAMNSDNPGVFATRFNNLDLQFDTNLDSVMGNHGIDTTDWEEPWVTPYLEADDLVDVDLAALHADLLTIVIEPLRRVQALTEQRKVTRLSSSLDADEMTVDPVFALNPDLGDVSNRYNATLVTECNGRDDFKAKRRLVLDDGRVYRLPSQKDLQPQTDSEYWMERTSEIDALFIEQHAKNGLPEQLTDETDAAWADVDGEAKGCGCRGPAMPYTAGLVVLLGALLARRRS